MNKEKQILINEFERFMEFYFGIKDNNKMLKQFMKSLTRYSKKISIKIANKVFKDIEKLGHIRTNKICDTYYTDKICFDTNDFAELQEKWRNQYE